MILFIPYLVTATLSSIFSELKFILNDRPFQQKHINAQQNFKRQRALGFTH